MQDATSEGSPFQTRAAAAGNARSPMVEQRIGGTTRAVEAAELSRRRETTSHTRHSSVDKYCGAEALPTDRQNIRCYGSKYNLSVYLSGLKSRGYQLSGLKC